MDTSANFARLIVLLFTFIAPTSLQASESCEGELNSARSSYFILRPHSQQLVVGALASISDGGRVLAVADYYSGNHEDLVLRLNKHFKVSQILWEGEILLINDLDRRARGIPKMSIDTSGHWFSGRHHLGPNDPIELKTFFESRWPTTRWYSMRHLKFSDRLAHLDPFLNSLHLRTENHKADPARHQFRNLVHVINNVLMLLEIRPRRIYGAEVKMFKSMINDSIDDIVAYTISRYRFSGSAQAVWPWNRDLLPELEEIAHKQSKVDDDYDLILGVLEAMSQNIRKPFEFLGP